MCPVSSVLYHIRGNIWTSGLTKQYNWTVNEHIFNLWFSAFREILWAKYIYSGPQHDKERKRSQCQCGDRCEVTWERCLNMPGGEMTEWHWKEKGEEGERSVRRQREEGEERKKHVNWDSAGHDMNDNVTDRTRLPWKQRPSPDTSPWSLTFGSSGPDFGQWLKNLLWQKVRSWRGGERWERERSEEGGVDGGN